MSKIRTRLTYANVMSSLAVFLLLGGAGAYAAQHHIKRIGTNQLKGGAVTASKLRAEAVESSKLKDGAVSAAKIEDGAIVPGKLAVGAVTTDKIPNDAITGDKVVESSLGEVPAANSANPGVFAHVKADGTVDAVNSKGLNSPNVTKPQNGLYCITVPAFNPRGGQVTTENTGTPGTSAQLTLGGTLTCPLPAVQVQTWVPGVTPTATNLAFYVELYH